jgi:phosphoglucosamine mutase
MTPETVVKLGRAVAHLFKAPGARRSIVIGKDTRLTGYMLETALTAGITSMGVDVILVGPLPTPGIAYITRSLRADAGVVISASHNSFEDNGIKFFSGDGLKLPDAKEAEIEEMITTGAIDRIRPPADEIGKAYRVGDAVGRYIEFAKSSFPKGLSLRESQDRWIARGARHRVCAHRVAELGADVVALNVAPDGININAGCGSLHPEELQRVVVAERAHAGFAHDGDADRVLAVDERGSLVDGDQILAMCALDLAAAGRLPARTAVATVMSNVGLEVALREAGITCARRGRPVRSGEMLRRGYAWAGQPGVIFAEHNTTGTDRHRAAGAAMVEPANRCRLAVAGFPSAPERPGPPQAGSRRAAGRAARIHTPRRPGRTGAGTLSEAPLARYDRAPTRAGFVRWRRISSRRSGRARMIEQGATGRGP